MMKKIVDGNGACSNIAYLFSEVCSIYPITPSSPMASNVDNLSNKKKNLFNEDVKVIGLYGKFAYIIKNKEIGWIESGYLEKI